MDDSQRPIGGPGTAVLVLWAPWAAPSRPAPTVLRELGRRWGDTITTLALEDPDDAVLDLLDVDVLPTWLILRRLADSDSGESNAEDETSTPAPDTEQDELPSISRGAEESQEGRGGVVQDFTIPSGASPLSGGSTPPRTTAPARSPEVDAGEVSSRVVLPGTWRVISRRTGALPKHEVANLVDQALERSERLA